ncbi:hypothetical protein AB0J89_33705 [Micromonospora chokoriensis]
MRLTAVAVGAALAAAVALTLTVPASPADHAAASPTAGSRLSDPTAADPTTGAGHHHQWSPADVALLTVDAGLLVALGVLLVRRPRIRHSAPTWTYRG